MDSSAWNRTGWVRDDLLCDGGSLIYCGFQHARRHSRGSAGHSRTDGASGAVSPEAVPDPYDGRAAQEPDRASVGDSRLARTAGYSPAIMPMTRVQPIPAALAHTGTTVGQSRLRA